MTKAELIVILEKRVGQIEKARNRFYFIYFPILLICYVYAYSFEPFPEYEYISVATVITILFFIILMIIDTWNKLASKIYCEHCTGEFSEDSLAYSVAVNECRNCKEPMYET